MQLVISGKRILTHGENFIAMGSVVVNPETNAKYNNATIAECSCVPSDIDSVGYEYHAGEFIPCAPYGKGDGTVPVLCGNDCKATKDSGIPLESFCLVEKKPYTGMGGAGAGGAVTLEFNHPPFMVFIAPKYANINSYSGYIQGAGGVSFQRTNSTGTINLLNATFDGKTVSFYHGSAADKGLNASGGEYEAIALCIRGL